MEPEFRFVDQYEGQSPSSDSADAASSSDEPTTDVPTTTTTTRVAPPLPPQEDDDNAVDASSGAEWRPRPHTWLLDAATCVFALAEPDGVAPADEFKERAVAAAHILRLCRALKMYTHTSRWHARTFFFFSLIFFCFFFFFFLQSVDWTASTAIVLMHRYLAYRTIPLHNKFVRIRAFCRLSNG
jgi:hypothetical protein